MATSPRPRRRILTAAAAISFLSSACGSGEEGPTAAAPEEETTVRVADALANDHGREDVAGASEASVELGDVFFSPTILVGETDRHLTVGLENIGAVDHTFTIPEQEVDVVLRPGMTGIAEVTFPPSGALLFVCRFHEDAGMRGGLSVEGDLEPAPRSAPGGDDTESGYGG